MALFGPIENSVVAQCRNNYDPWRLHRSQCREMMTFLVEFGNVLYRPHHQQPVLKSVPSTNGTAADICEDGTYVVRGFSLALMSKTDRK